MTNTTMWMRATLVAGLIGGCAPLVIEPIGHGSTGSGGGTTVTGLACYECTCQTPQSQLGCADLCDQDLSGEEAPNFCNGAPALSHCAACIMKNCGVANPNDCATPFPIGKADGGATAPACADCACALLSAGGCAELCDKHVAATAAPNFCNGVPALPQCANCMAERCGVTPSNPCTPPAVVPTCRECACDYFTAAYSSNLIQGCLDLCASALNGTPGTPDFCEGAAASAPCAACIASQCGVADPANCH